MGKKRLTKNKFAIKVADNPGTVSRLFTCTFIKTTILNNEWEVCFRISSSDDIQSLYSFISPESVSVTFESLDLSDRKCVCLGCGRKQIGPSKGLVLRLNQSIRSCSKCPKRKGRDSSPNKPSDTEAKDADDVSRCCVTQEVQKAVGEEPSCKGVENAFRQDAADSENSTKVDKSAVREVDKEFPVKRLRLRKVKLNLQPSNISKANIENNESDDDKIFNENVPVKSRRLSRKKGKTSNIDDIKPCVCTTCGKQLRNVKTLKSHMTIHQTSGVYQCDICHHEFSHQRYLKKHRKTHILDKPYSCDICGQQFKLKGSLPKHKILHSELKPFKCNTCEKQFHLKDQLAKHVRIHSDARDFVCKLCGKTFRTRGSMKSHEDTHDGPLKHRCDHCGKSYRSVWYLNIHMKTHTGKDLIQCHSCGDWFIDPCYFKLHQRKFCKGNPLACKVCQMEFPHNQALQSHMGLHSGERPHGCKICGKAFSKTSLLNEHTKRHTLENCKNCRYCKKGFINTKELKRHERCHVKQKKKASLPERLKPGRVERVVEEIHVDHLALEGQDATQNNANQISIPTYIVTVKPASSDSRSRTRADASSVSCIVYNPNHLTVSADGSITTNQAMEQDPMPPDYHQVMDSLAATSDHDPVYPRPAAPSYSLASPVPGQSGIISTSDGEHLEQLRPVGSNTDRDAVYENETSVQHLLQAAALIKDKNYPSQF